jgi:hypothetical protein
MKTLLAILATASLAFAEAQRAEEALAPQADWPLTFTVTAADVRTRIEAAKMWTISGIEFQDTEMAVQDSAYGTVLTIRGVGHLGTAHFLDVPGTPGQVEKEKVTSLRLYVDEKPIAKFQPQMQARGKSFRMERKSSIRSLQVESTVSIRDNVLIETSHWHATQPIDLQKGHPSMYAFTPRATVYAFGDASGIHKRGVFREQGKLEMTEKTSRWMAVFDPVNGKGSVCYVAKQPAEPDAAAWFLVIDAPGVYRKLALFTFVEKVVPEGFDGTFQTAVGFFSAAGGDWESAALKRVAELKSYLSKLGNP